MTQKALFKIWHDVSFSHGVSFYYGRILPTFLLLWGLCAAMGGSSTLYGGGSVSPWDSAAVGKVSPHPDVVQILLSCIWLGRANTPCHPYLSCGERHFPRHMEWGCSVALRTCGAGWLVSVLSHPASTVGIILVMDMGCDWQSGRHTQALPGPGMSTPLAVFHLNTIDTAFSAYQEPCVPPAPQSHQLCPGYGLG